jgi:hypothetical protein
MDPFVFLLIIFYPKCQLLLGYNERCPDYYIFFGRFRRSRGSAPKQKTKLFGRWSVDEGLTDEDLCHTVDEIGRGLVKASLGPKLYKKRVAKTRQGKSSGFRTIVTYQKEDRSIFLYGFDKGSKTNIAEEEKKIFKKMSG